ncbi:MAG: sigma-70 family RNA polymerase sigma factor [Proteobacteria bacterium]|nr:MAG: sigma-70 family RNA polymerase sigma factor [Pseudomonadota bacterium]
MGRTILDTIVLRLYIKPLISCPSGLKRVRRVGINANMEDMSESSLRESVAVVSPFIWTEEKFEQFVRAHAVLFMSIALRLAPNRMEAEDLVSETIISLYSRLAKLPADDAHAKAYAVRTLTNFWVRSFRMSRSLKRSAGLQITADRVDDEIAEKAFDAQLVGDHVLRELVDQLPDTERDVIIMHYFDDVPYEEISEKFGISLGAVKMRRKRALKKLRELYDPAEGEEVNP